MTLHVLCVSGSLAAGSANRRWLDALRSCAPDGVETREGRFDTLPLFDPTQPPTPAVEQWREGLGWADVVVIASPEYGHSLPGALKNAIDHVIGSGELYEKPVVITAAVPHRDRGRRGLAALATTLRAVSAQILWDEPIETAEGISAEVLAQVWARIGAEV